MFSGLALISGFVVLSGVVAGVGASADQSQTTPSICADNQPATSGGTTNLYGCTPNEGQKIVTPASVTTGAPNAPVTLVSTGTTSTLPLTGGDVAGLVATGLALLAVGGVLVRRNRRRSSQAT